jgi:hypothetical protein
MFDQPTHLLTTSRGKMAEKLKRSLKKTPAPEIGEAETNPSSSYHFADVEDFSSQIGVMNLLRTGNIVIDTAVSMFVPVLFSSFGFFLKIVFPIIESIMDTYLFIDDSKMVTLDYEVLPPADSLFDLSQFYEDNWGDVTEVGEDKRNSLLQKAIMAYITEVNGVKSVDTQISLSASHHLNEPSGDSVDQLANYKVSNIPPEEVYVQITEDISFYHDQWDESEEQAQRNKGRNKLNKKKEEDNYKSNKRVISFSFMAKGKDGEKKIRDFVDVSLSNSVSLTHTINL